MSDRGNRCSLRSEAAGEPLAGTASTIRRWLLIEHPGPWGRDGLLDARLPPGLGVELRALERRTRSRVLLIRRTTRRAGDGTACFAVDTAEGWIGATTLEQIDDAVRLDPASRDGFASRVESPVAVVCTHGRRDACCAERGRPLAAATATRFPDVVWESTHVGGDRFAGNLVVFPHGLVYGRVEPSTGGDVIDAYGRGRIVLDRYRGRTSHPMVAQAADLAARVELGLDGIDDVAVLSIRRSGGTAAVRLRLPVGEALVRLARERLPAMRLTCASDAGEAAVSWRVGSIEGAA